MTVVCSGFWCFWKCSNLIYTTKWSLWSCPFLSITCFLCGTVLDGHLSNQIGAHYLFPFHLIRCWCFVIRHLPTDTTGFLLLTHWGLYDAKLALWLLLWESNTKQLFRHGINIITIHIYPPIGTVFLFFF